MRAARVLLAGMAVLAGTLVASSPAGAVPFGLFTDMYKNNPLMAMILGIVLVGVLLMFAGSALSTSWQIRRKTKALQKCNTFLAAKNYDEAINLCKSCYIESWRGMYTGQLVVYNAAVLAKLIQSLKMGGREISPELEALANSFRDHAANGRQALLDLKDQHEDVKKRIERA